MIPASDDCGRNYNATSTSVYRQFVSCDSKDDSEANDNGNADCIYDQARHRLCVRSKRNANRRARTYNVVFSVEDAHGNAVQVNTPIVVKHGHHRKCLRPNLKDKHLYVRRLLDTAEDWLEDSSVTLQLDPSR